MSGHVCEWCVCVCETGNGCSRASVLLTWAGELDDIPHHTQDCAGLATKLGIALS
jgi:hypothetical protein